MPNLGNTSHGGRPDTHASGLPRGRKKCEVPVVKDIENIVLPDEAPETDVIEQHLIIDDDDESGLDTTYFGTIRDQEANEADLIDQATVVPLQDGRLR
jgi:hypothetical protein